MKDDEEIPQERVPGEISPFTVEQKLQALEVGWPREELRKRIGLITNLDGRAPPWTLVYLVMAEAEVQDAIIEDREINWVPLDLAFFTMSHTPSIKARSRKELTIIASLANAAGERPRTIWDKLLGR